MNVSFRHCPFKQKKKRRGEGRKKICVGFKFRRADAGDYRRKGLIWPLVIAERVALGVCGGGSLEKLFQNWCEKNTKRERRDGGGALVAGSKQQPGIM